MRQTVFELLDFPRFGSPSVIDISAVKTAEALAERLSEPGFMSYASLWPKLADLVRDGLSEDHIVSLFSFYKDDWKNRAMQSAARALNSLMSGKGVWYRQPTSLRSVAGFTFKTSIRGIWFHEGRSYAVLINARKSQRLTKGDVAFLARGIYELYCIDDPNDPIPMIIDLSARHNQKERSPISYVVPVSEAMSLKAFEEALKVFVEAMTMIGLAVSPPAGRTLMDLLKQTKRA